MAEVGNNRQQGSLLISKQPNSEGIHPSLSQDWRYSCHPLRQSAVSTTEVLRAHMLTFRWWPQVQEDRAGSHLDLAAKSSWAHTGWLVALSILFQHLTMVLSLLVDERTINATLQADAHILFPSLKYFQHKKTEIWCSGCPTWDTSDPSKLLRHLYVSTACPITCLSPTDTAHFKAENSRQMLWRTLPLPTRKHQLREKWKSPFLMCRAEGSQQCLCAPCHSTRYH